MNCRLPERLKGLHRPSAYPHPVAALTVLQTHISWVILTGPYAYKIKKDVAPGFLDFSTLALRHQACLKELELNRRLAPQLYREVVAITGIGDDAQIGGDGPVTEYAVSMRQFDRQAQLDRMLLDDRVDADLMQQLARRIGGFHEQAPAAPPDGAAGQPADILAKMLDNFAPVRAQLRADGQTAALDELARIETWTRHNGSRLETTMAQRLADGRVREGHGDLHLSNLVCLDDGVTAFDCIEFSPALRWIDVMSDIGFLVMDLRSRGRDELAFAFLNEYLEYGGDYSGIAVLDFYVAYRSMVRAKVACLLLGEVDNASEEAADARRRLHHHLVLATAVIAPRPRAHLILMHGLSGSGKSWLSERLAARLGALRVRSDVERKRLAGLPPGQPGTTALDTGLYSPRATRQTYRRLRDVGRSVCAIGWDLIVDATFLKRAQRVDFARLAESLSIDWTLVNCTAPPEQLALRIRRRSTAGQDASDAGIEVLRQQQRSAEALTAGEHPHVVEAAGEFNDAVVAAVATAINRRRTDATGRRFPPAAPGSQDPAA